MVALLQSVANEVDHKSGLFLNSGTSVLSGFFAFAVNGFSPEA
jgi:hypothetical protein